MSTGTLRLPTRYFRRYPPEAFLGYAQEEIQIGLQHTAFLAVDVMGDKSEVMANHVVPAMDAARRLGLPIVYAANSAPRVDLDHYEFAMQRDRNAQHYFPRVIAEPSVDPREYHAGSGPWSHYWDAVAPRPGDYYVRKIAYSGFHETRLDSVLRHLGADTLICVGFVISECLLGTLIDAYSRNYRAILLRDCTLAGEETRQEHATRSFTQRMILWCETYICSSSTSEEFVAASAAVNR